MIEISDYLIFPDGSFIGITYQEHKLWKAFNDTHRASYNEILYHYWDIDLDENITAEQKNIIRTAVNRFNTTIIGHGKLENIKNYGYKYISQKELNERKLLRCFKFQRNIKTGIG